MTIHCDLTNIIFFIKRLFTNYLQSIYNVGFFKKEISEKSRKFLKKQGIF